MIGARALSRNQAVIVSANVEWEAPVQVILDEDESQSYMSLIVSQVLDQVELSDEAADFFDELAGETEAESGEHRMSGRVGTGGGLVRVSTADGSVELTTAN